MLGRIHIFLYVHKLTMLSSLIPSNDETHSSLAFSSKSEADASDLLENLEDIYVWSEQRYIITH